MKKLLSFMIICHMILAVMATSCMISAAAESVPDANAATSGDTGEDAIIAVSDDTGEADSRFVFQSKVSSSFLEEVFGETMCEAWFNLVDAVMAGEDTFACPDSNTFNWIMGQFRDRCFPLLVDLIDYPYDRSNPVKDGIGQFVYTVPREEAAQKIEEFKLLVEDILNEALEPGYTDFEKALALYCYFSRTYEYDYETYEQDLIRMVDFTSSYRFLTHKTGICREASRAYAYLLMQAGVDASIVMGGDHEWSILKLGDNYYHIDPTFVMGSCDSLQYFMLDDVQRFNEGGYAKEDFIYVSNYTQDHPCPDFTAADDSCKPLWSGELESFNHLTGTLTYLVYGEDDEPQVCSFDYRAY